MAKMSEIRQRIREYAGARNAQSDEYTVKIICSDQDLLIMRLDFRPGEELRSYSPRSTYLSSTHWSMDGHCELVWDRRLTMEEGYTTANLPDLRYGSGGHCEDATAALILRAWTVVADDAKQFVS